RGCGQRRVAYVVDGGVIGIGCGPGGVTTIVNLAAKTSASMNIPQCGASSGAAYVASIGDGSRIGFGASSIGAFAIYVPAQGTWSTAQIHVRMVTLSKPTLTPRSPGACSQRQHHPLRRFFDVLEGKEHRVGTKVRRDHDGTQGKALLKDFTTR